MHQSGGRFVARYRWLKQVLNFDPSRLPEESCDRFKEWYRLLNPGRVTVIFPTNYLNNPSSMFGHTLLRIDPKGQSMGERLTSYGVNYGANTSESQGLLFAVKGILGGYSGAFSVAPYYLQVKEYSDIENRDIWEYELNFSAEEIKLLVYHLWELRGVQFDYYFFDENCSYHLLSLLENGRPESKLRSKVGSWVIPIDTIREILKQNGILKRAVYRPSSKKILDLRLAKLSLPERIIAKDIASRKEDVTEKLSAIPEERRGDVIDAGVDYIAYQTLKNPETTKGAEEIEEYQFNLLLERSKLPAETLPPSPVEPPRPDLGHLTNRLLIGTGAENRELFYNFSIRPAYHDLLDPEWGYAPGAQIQFLNLDFRQQEHSGLKLEQLQLLDIISLSPWDEVFKGFSWRVSTGAARQRFGENERYLTYNFELGAGLTVKPSARTTAFALLGPQLFLTEKLEQKLSVGIGPSIGLFTDVTDNLRILMQFKGGEYIGELRTYRAATEARYTLERNLAIKGGVERSLNFGRNSDYENWSTTLSLAILKYF